MSKLHGVGFASLMLCLFASHPSHATVINGLVNGGFEMGNFTGWSTIGVTSIKNASFGSGPTEGTNQALLTNSGGSVFDSDPGTPSTIDSLEEFLGLPAGSLDGLGNGNAFEGSAIKQTFSASAGQVLTFDWNFLTDELTPDTVFATNDFAFVNINPFSTLANTFSTFVLSPTSFLEETGFSQFSYTIPTDGSFTLGLGVVDVVDPIFDSGLLVDNVMLSPVPDLTVPEPASIALFSLGFAGLSWMNRKKKMIQIGNCQGSCNLNSFNL